MPFLTVLGHSNIDIQLTVADMPGGGRSSPVTSRRTVWGGTGANIARHAAGLGVPVRLWSRIGDDFPDDWRNALATDGVELALEIVAGALTPTCYVLTTPGGEQAYCMDQGAMRPPYELQESIIDENIWLHVGTGDPSSYRPLVEKARRYGNKIALDPGQEIHYSYDELSFHSMLELADVLFVNEVELEAAYKLCSYGDPIQFLDHVDALVITRGAKGAELWTNTGRQQLPAPTVEVADPTGAGDALRAGWYAGLYQGLEMEEALKLGVRSGAAATKMDGPQPYAITMDDLP